MPRTKGCLVAAECACGRKTSVTQAALGTQPQCRLCRKPPAGGVPPKPTARAVLLRVLAEWHARFPGEWVHRTNLVLECWQADKSRFGLDQLWPLYPDANRVVSEIQHAIAAGLVERQKPNLFRLTKAGGTR